MRVNEAEHALDLPLPLPVETKMHARALIHEGGMFTALIRVRIDKKPFVIV